MNCARSATSMACSGLPTRCSADLAAPASETQTQGGVQGQDEEPAQLQLSQAVFERQQALWQQQVGALLSERPGVVDVYGLVFAAVAVLVADGAARVLRERRSAPLRA